MGEPFRHRMRVRYHECDQQGVVFNAHYLAYCDICLVELWRETVEGYAGVAAKGLDVVVAEARIRSWPRFGSTRSSSCGSPSLAWARAR